MSASGTTATGRGSGRTVVVGVGAVVLVVLMLILAGSGDSAVRLSPRSDRPQGTSGLVAVLRELGAEVDLDVASPALLDGNDMPAYDTVLLLRDQLDDTARRTEVMPWVNEGGLLVVADPRSALAPVGGSALSPYDGQFADLEGDLSTIERGDCDIQVLAELDVEELAVEGTVQRFGVADRDSSCFGQGGRGFVVASTRGQGTVVSLGSAGVLTNEALAGQESRDNAVVLAALLAPAPGTRVAVLDPTAVVVPSDESLWDLIPTWVKRVGLQLVVVTILFVLWQGRRLGRPVPERRPVDVASSDLVAAVGGLLRRAGTPQHAAELLRSDLRRDLVGRLGLPPTLAPAEFFSTVEARSRLDAGQLRLALGPGPVTSDAELLDVAHAIDSVRKEVLHSVGS